MENINQFDPIAWANNNADNAPYNNKVEMQPSTPPTSSVTRQPTSDTSEQLEALVQAIVAHGINLTEDYNDWLRVGFALAGELGEDGRTYFHRLSQMSAKYDAEECDKKYDNCLHAKGQGVKIETLYWMAGQAGIDLKALAHERHSRELCAECADAQPCAKRLVCITRSDNQYSLFYRYFCARLRICAFCAKLYRGGSFFQSYFLG
jgi:hypothetical protein